MVVRFDGDAGFCFVCTVPFSSQIWNVSLWVVIFVASRSFGSVWVYDSNDWMYFHETIANSL